jgi:hypothetical protein
MALGDDGVARGGETEARQPTVDALVLARSNLVGLVPYTHIASTSGHSLIKVDPRGLVLPLGISRIRLELLKGSPVLDDHLRGHDVTQES